MEVAVNDRRQIIRRMTGASDHETELSRVDSWDAGMRLVAKANRTARQKGRELIESHFWLGGAIARAESYSEWGDGFFDRVERESGVSHMVARRAMKMWDLFGGDVVELHRWCAKFIEEHGKVLLGDIGELIKNNREITDGRQHLRGVKARLKKLEISPEIIESSGLGESLERRAGSLEEMVIEAPAASQVKNGRLPIFRHIRTLKSARQKLIFEPDVTVPIDTVTLADGIEYEVVVSLRPRQSR